MKRRLIIRSKAEADLLQAARWYESERLGLGREFLDEAYSLAESLFDFPLRFPKVYGEY